MMSAPPLLAGLGRLRPRTWDILVVVVTALLCVPDLFGPDSPGLVRGVLGTAALIAPLWWRRRAPMWAWIAVTAIMLGEWLLDIWISADLALLIMLYAVARYASTRILAVAAAVTVGQTALAIYVLTTAAEHQLLLFLLLLGTGAAGIALGLTARTRQAHLRSLEDRATQAEIERDQRAQLAAAAERARVAREMHDIVGHHVSVIVGLADGGATLAESRDERAAEPLRLIGETGRQALAELRRVLGVLREDTPDPQLRPQPGIADLDRLLPSIRAAGLTVVHRTSGDLGRIGPGLQLAVYRIVQEALTNSLKHAGRGATAKVTVAAEDHRITVRIVDSGPSDPRHQPRASGDQHGIAGMRERAGLYGGTVTAGPDENGGWLVEAAFTEEHAA